MVKKDVEDAPKRNTISRKERLIKIKKGKCSSKLDLKVVNVQKNTLKDRHSGRHIDEVELLRERQEEEHNESEFATTEDSINFSSLNDNDYIPCSKEGNSKQSLRENGLSSLTGQPLKKKLKKLRKKTELGKSVVDGRK